ncbi:glutathione S-transferase [Salinarimonas sp.]|uniref:glutathione S-transferase family protein n=1 Tax=Salinarimonas sp. TaxID=2766526 RepID=UPI0032D91A4D
MMELWGRTNSVNVQKVIWLLEELALPYRRIDAGGAFGVVDTPAYRTLNPNGRVPTLVDGEVVLWESNAILRYLALKTAAHGLYPEDPADRGRIERWMDWTLSTVGGAMHGMFWGLVRTPPEKRDPDAIERSRAASESCWRLLDAHLTGREHLEAGRFTLADIPLGCYVHRWYAMPEIERPDLPYLRAWYEGLLARPAYAQHVAQPLT